jgi:hypothetical protein
MCVRLSAYFLALAVTCPYPRQVHGVVYVVDSADQARIAESKEELDKALEHPMIVGKPLLVYVLLPKHWRCLYSFQAERAVSVESFV